MIEHALVYAVLACVFGFFMAWGVGANDVANAMGTSVGSGALTMRQAIVIAIIFEAAGSLFASGQVTHTIGSGMLHLPELSYQTHNLILGMLASLLAAGTWLLVATYFGWPVSTTHSIVGAVLGFSTVCLGVESVAWGVIGNIALSWLVTPLLAGLLAYLLFNSVQRFIFNTEHPIACARYWIPAYIFVVVFVMAMVTFTQGLKNHLHMARPMAVGLSCVFSVVGAFVGYSRLKQLPPSAGKSHRLQFEKVEQMFALLMVVTAAAMAFAHGSNDVANAVGPLAAVINIVQSKHGLAAAMHAPTPYWVMVLGAAGIVTGLMMYGFKVIATIGNNITQLTPSRGFAAQLATATIVVLSSGFGLPVSTTQVMVGSVLGVGLARGIGALNLRVVRNIFMSWMITLPIGAFFAILYFQLLRYTLARLL